MVPCKREVLVTALKPQGAQRPRENEISRAASAPESGRRLVEAGLPWPTKTSNARSKDETLSEDVRKMMSRQL